MTDFTHHVSNLTIALLLALTIGNIVPEKVFASQSLNHHELKKNNYFLHLENNQVTFIGRQLSQTDFLKITSDRLHIRFSVRTQLDNTKWDWQLINAPLDVAIRNIFKQYNLIMHYETISNTNNSIVTEIIILPKRESASILPSSIEFRKKNELTDKLSIVKLEGLTDEIAVSQLSHYLKRAIEDTNRIQAAKILEDIGSKAAKQHVEDSLGDHSAKVRRSVVKLLSKRADDNATQLLGQVIHGDSDISVRIAALYGLSNISGTAANYFINAAKNDENEYIKEIATTISNHRNWGSQNPDNHI